MLEHISMPDSTLGHMQIPSVQKASLLSAGRERERDRFKSLFMNNYFDGCKTCEMMKLIRQIDGIGYTLTDFISVCKANRRNYAQDYTDLHTVEHVHAAYVGEKCERDVDCIENAFCRWQEMCLCNPFYSPSLDKSKCIATVGLSCLDNTPCQTITNSECKQNTCTCKDDFFLDSKNSSNCIRRPVKIGDQCQANTDLCRESFNYALCINEKCQCITGYHFVNETGACVQSRALYFTCSNNYECYEGDKSLDTMECKNQQCVCREGERCKGSLMTAAGILVAISYFLQQVAR